MIESGDHKLQGNDNKEIAQVLNKLSILDKLLPILIALAITLGLLLGNFVPNVKVVAELVQVDGVSLPVCIGLIWMMFPVLAKVNYELIPSLLTSKILWKQLVMSLVINWLLGPTLMTLLAWLTLPDLPEYRTGIILVGIARCIAMVLIWNTLAGGHSEYCAILVAINSILQIALYGPLAILIIKIIPESLNLESSEINIELWTVVKGVLIYLGIPLLLGIVTRYTLLYFKGRKWYNERFLPKFGPASLLGLLFTIVILFAIQGKEVIQNPSNVARLAVPLILYFFIIFFSTFFMSYLLNIPYEIAVTQSFTASGNNFELAIAICIGTFGVSSPQALGAVIGPLIEVPVLLILVYVSLFFKKFYQRKIAAKLN
ncbi:arsenical-resistance protein ACR3 [Neoconidiobolus thromboides FSU 785]|nr:arsenical-resistance protein ACR3 [Neoconidiobolus thromboides FSU 785]